MNEEFSGGGQWAGARENKVGPLGGVWGMGEEPGAFDGSSKRVQSGRKREKLPSNA